MNLVTQLLCDPQIVRDWRPPHWNRFLPLVRSARLQGRCHFLLQEHGLLDSVPARIRDQFLGALAQTRYVQGQALRELKQVSRTLAAQGIEVMVLKGGAYLAAGLPPAAWRNLSDIDLLLHESDIARAEQTLQAAGWVPSGEFDDYDQHYYRDWMHEVPPLVHLARETEVDLHHNLAPPVSRIRIDASRLWENAREVSDPHGEPAKVLSSEDILLHNAVHLFMNDELRGGLRDVVDFRDLFEHFVAADAGFEQKLLSRARELQCVRPLFYAVDTARRLIGLQPSDTLRVALRASAPAAPVRALMRWLIGQALAPAATGMRRTAVANQLLFIRSHWVRMPPLMLLRHLWHKALVSKKPASHDAEMPG